MIDELDDGLHLFAEVRVRHAEDGHVGDLRVDGQHVLRLLGVDVDAAADDHVGLAVGQVEEAVLVELADVAEGAPAVLEEGVARLLGRVVVLEALHVRGAEVDAALLADRELVALLVDDVNRAGERLADGSLVGEPVLGRGVAEAVALGSGVVLVDDRSPPVEHLLLDLDGAGRGRVDREGQAAHVVLVADLLLELEHPHEHRRDPLAVGALVPVDRRQGALGVEALHHDDRRPHAQEVLAVAERSGVVEGCRRQVDRVAASSEEELRHHRHPVSGAERRSRERGLHALRTSRRSGRVEHRLRFHPVGQRGRLELRDRRLEVLESLELTADNELRLDLLENVAEAGYVLGLVGTRDEGAAAAVFEDVAKLFRRQAGADGGVVEAGVVGAPEDREVVEAILHAEGHVIARSEARRMEELGQAVRLVLELGVGHRLAVRRHDHGGLVGRERGPGSRVVRVLGQVGRGGHGRLRTILWSPQE